MTRGTRKNLVPLCRPANVYGQFNEADHPGRHTHYSVIDAAYCVASSVRCSDSYECVKRYGG